MLFLKFLMEFAEMSLYNSLTYFVPHYSGLSRQHLLADYVEWDTDPGVRKKGGGGEGNFNGQYK